ncbi:MAG: ankyrin repeat domain-containing protein [Acidobacteriota bacterium]|nr:ankyrin repeat domain-containing protein [Acidobacteriota bacterium]
MNKELSPERKHEIGISVLLFEASMFGHTRTIKEMLEIGANVNVRVSDIYVEDEGIFNKKFAFTQIDGDYTPLLAAIKYGADINVIEVLLKNGADVNVKTKNGQTPLTLASEKGRKDVVELLQKSGAE